MISKYSTFPVFEARSKKVILWLRLFCIGLVAFAIATEILISRTVGPGSYLEELHNQLFFAIMNSILTPLVIIQFFYGNSNESGRLVHRNFRRERPHCGKNYKHYPQHHPFR